MGNGVTCNDVDALGSRSSRNVPEVRSCLVSAGQVHTFLSISLGPRTSGGEGSGGRSSAWGGLITGGGWVESQLRAEQGELLAL
jgi:hypothetical protein